MSNAYLYAQSLLPEVPELRYRPGEDVAAWQQKTRAKLKELIGWQYFVPADPRPEIEWEKETETYREIAFTFESEPGYRVPCRMRLPHGVEKPIPVICLQGHSKGMHISLGEPKYPGDEETMKGGDRDFAVRAVREGFAPIAVEQRYMGTCGGDEKGPGCGRGMALTSLLLGRTAIGERVWDISRLIDLLERDYADRLEVSRLICMGNSGGGTATFYAGCVDERIRTVMPSCALCTYKDSIASIQHCSCNYIPNAARYFDMGDLAGLVAPRPFLAVAGREDNIFPLKGVKESMALAETVYAAMGIEKNCRLVVGESGHRFYADAAWSTYREMQQ